MSILRRIPGERFSEVVREWEAATVAILAGGPSLTREAFVDVGRLRTGSSSFKAIAVNDAYLLAPYADVCHFADSQWWRWQTDGIARPMIGMTAENVRARFASFAGQKCSLLWSGSNITDDCVHILRCKRAAQGDEHGGGISLDPKMLASGRNSGYQALNLAILAGAKKILLFGFDGAQDEAGRSHWFGENPRSVPWQLFFESMRRSFSAAEREIVAAGITVINCNLRSAIDSFPKMTLEEAIA
jgi:hypothetical protein